MAQARRSYSPSRKRPTDAICGCNGFRDGSLRAHAKRSISVTPLTTVIQFEATEYRFDRPQATSPGAHVRPGLVGRFAVVPPADQDAATFITPTDAILIRRIGQPAVGQLPRSCRARMRYGGAGGCFGASSRRPRAVLERTVNRPEPRCRPAASRLPVETARRRASRPLSHQLWAKSFIDKSRRIVGKPDGAATANLDRGPNRARPLASNSASVS